jgi:hypothetical protein
MIRRIECISSLLSLAVACAVSQTRLDSALSFLPMAPGLKWTYSARNLGGYGWQPSYQDMESYGPVLVANGRSYYRFVLIDQRSRIRMDSTLLGIDSTTGIVNLPPDGNSLEWPIDTLLGASESWIQDTVLGFHVATLSIHHPFFNYTDEIRLAAGIGMFYQHGIAGTEIPYERMLVYAKIGDHTYGSPQSITSLSPLPSEMEVSEAYPNPFNSSTTCQLSLGSADNVRVTIVDILGRTVAVLTDHRFEIGEHSISWDAKDMPTGFYFLRAAFSSHSILRKLVYVR